MQRFELLPHTADVAMRAEGSSREELLQASLQGMFAAAEPRYLAESGIVRRPFEVRAPDFPSLLVDVLGEALYFSDTHREAYEDATWEEVTDTLARGTFFGRKVTGFETQIKAVTHHELKAERRADDMWEAAVIFDA